MDLPPVVCIQCGQGPLGIKVIGPTIGFFVTVAFGVSSNFNVSMIASISDNYVSDLLLAGSSFLRLLRN